MRDYEPLVAAARARTGLTPGQAMAKAVSLLWDAFGGKPISWVGFYLKVEGADEMVLVCREPKPACSPIGLHGMCGRSFLTRRAISWPMCGRWGPTTSRATPGTSRSW